MFKNNSEFYSPENIIWSKLNNTDYKYNIYKSNVYSLGLSLSTLINFDLIKDDRMTNN